MRRNLYNFWNVFGYVGCVRQREKETPQKKETVNQIFQEKKLVLQKDKQTNGVCKNWWRGEAVRDRYKKDRGTETHTYNEVRRERKKHTDRETKTHKQWVREKKKETYWQRNRNTYKHWVRDTNKETYRATGTPKNNELGTERKKLTDRDTETHTNNEWGRERKTYKQRNK